MNRMDVFSSAINESFNYNEIEWQGNSYLVDFTNRNSLAKFIN